MNQFTATPNPADTVASTLNAPHDTALAIDLRDRHHTRRRTAEKFVRTVYARAYGARLTTFYPDLLCITDAASQHAAATGTTLAFRVVAWGCPSSSISSSYTAQRLRLAHRASTAALQ